MRAIALALLALLAGCVAAPPPPPEVLEACPVDAALLDRCRLPVSLPADGGEAVLTIWSALLECDAAARAAQDALRWGGSREDHW